MSITDVNNVLSYARSKGIGKSLTNRDPYGEPTGVIDHPGDLERLHASTEILCKDIADILVKKFPGFAWAVQPSEIGKVFNIYCLDFNGRWGYRIKYKDIMDDPKRREIVKAGREILQRFNYPGIKYDKTAVAMVPRNAKGEAIPYCSGLKPTRQTKIADLELKLATGHARVAANVSRNGEHGKIIVVEK